MTVLSAIALVGLSAAPVHAQSGLITFTKEGPRYFTPGLPVIFTFTIDNAGDVELHKPTVTDQPSGAVATCPGAIPAHHVRTCTLVYWPSQEEIDAGEIHDYATLTGTLGAGPAATPLGPLESNHLTTVEGPTFIKEGPTGFAGPNEVLTYTYTIAVPAGSTYEQLTNMSVTDDHIVGPITNCQGNLAGPLRAR